MTEYTPNVEDLARAAYCDYLAGTSRTRDESATEFDHWLAQVKAEAWGEGWSCGNAYALETPTRGETAPWANPYRKKQTDAD